MPSRDIEPRPNEQWLAALRGGDGGVVEDLQRYLQRGLTKVLRHRRDVTPEDIQDFTQETLLQVVRSLDGFRGDSMFTTWALAVGTRVAFTALRRRRVKEQELDEFALTKEQAEVLHRQRGADQEGALSRTHVLEALRDGIANALTERQRVAILAELGGVPTVEVAERLGTNQNALYKLTHDARKRLKKALEAAGYTALDVRRELREGAAQ